MSKLLIKGGHALEGRVKISGAKNSAVAVIAATLLVRGETILENVPYISDVVDLFNIIRKLGVKVKWLDNETVSIMVPDDIDCVARYDEVTKLRASNLLLGSLLGRVGFAAVALPGGCDLGARPMDLHLKGFRLLGADMVVHDDHIKGKANQLEGATIYLDFPSVGATENIMMAASVANGHTVIENVAKEPEIVDLANFLNKSGAKVRGAGTDIIRIEGVSELRGSRHSIIPDRIEAGTFIVAAAMTDGVVSIDNIIVTHIKPVIAKMQEAGILIEEHENSVLVHGNKDYNSVDVKTLAYPGFPTDMQPLMMSFLSLANGESNIQENLFENRMKVAPDLNRMGANIEVIGQTAKIVGVKSLHGAIVKAHDLRAGAALVCAALAAEGETEITHVHYIDRGYLEIEQKLTMLGADVKRID